MARTFYTEHDIQDLAKRGVTEIEIDDSVYITDLAREKMEALGLQAKAIRKSAIRPQPIAPSPGVETGIPVSLAAGTVGESERRQLIEKVKSGVIARLGGVADAALVDMIVRRVVSQL